MVLSHRNHGNFSKKMTCFLKLNQKEKPKCQDFSENKKYELCIVNCGVPIAILLHLRKFEPAHAFLIEFFLQLGQADAFRGQFFHT